MTSGKCPHCKATVSKARVEAITIQKSDGVTFPGVSYTCSGCNAVLSVSLDPIAVKDELVKELRRILGR